MRLIAFLVLTILILSFWFRDAKVKKFILITFAVLLLIIILGLLFVWITTRDRVAYMESYDQYCPARCPNTLWTCTEGDIYFASDEDGKLRGAVKTDKETAYYKIFFIQREGRGFYVSGRKSLSVANSEALSFSFDGDASYSDGVCTIVYQAEDDTEHYFGEREGEVWLTFIKSDLTAPFSFDSEKSLNELPFR